MIGKLKGRISDISQNQVLIDTGYNVFYKVFLPAVILKNVTEGDEVTCYTYFHVRENEISLYGFPDTEYQRIFELLISIPNIGPKSAMTIIGFNPLSKLIEAVKNQDSQYFAKIPGIGKKTSQKILLELSGRFMVEFKPKLPAETEDDNLVIQALMSLGLKKHEAVVALEKVDRTLPLEERITVAIRNLNHHG